MSLSRSNPTLLSVFLIGICAIVLAAVALTQSAYAGAECASLGGGCDDSGDWDPMAKLDEIGNKSAVKEAAAKNWPAESRKQRWGMGTSQDGDEDEGGEASDSNESTANTRDNQDALNGQTVSETGDAEVAQDIPPAKIAEKKINMTRSSSAGDMLLPLDEINDSDILLDVSENSSLHIEGSVVIPYMEFDIEPGMPKPVEDVARTLGEAGISREDSVVVYGECLPCGGGPSVATYVYWIMKSLGHERVKVLDGTAGDWAASGRGTSESEKVLASKEYIPMVRPNYTATYELVQSGQAQIVDARTVPEYAMATIPGSISIPYDSVLNEKRITGEDRLDMVFMMLEKNKPVVVFTNTGMKGSVVWFALEMMGYDARLYSYQDWHAHQEHDLEDVDEPGEINETTA